MTITLIVDSPRDGQTHTNYYPFHSVDEAKRDAERRSGGPLAWTAHENEVVDFEFWRKHPFVRARAGGTVYTITGHVCWVGSADDPALIAHNAAMRMAGRPEIRGW